VRCQNFHRDEPVELRIVPFQDDAHPAASDRFDDVTAIPGPWDRLDANETKRQSGETYRKRGRITFSSVL
jgi:hypothetical protein